MTPCRVNDAALRRLHARGLTDGEVARRLGAARNTVRNHRRALGLPSNAGPEARRRAAARAARAVCGRYGCRSLRHLGLERQRVAAALAGWPAGCTARQADALRTLRDRGPLATPDFAAAYGASRRLALRMLEGLRRLGHVTRGGYGSSQRGRLPAVWSLAPELAALMAGREDVA